MNPIGILAIIIGYMVLLYLVSYATSRKASSETFYTAERKAPWFLVSYGMIGVAISGITFVSVPGEVLNSGFTYFQIVMGYSLGLIMVAYVLLPLYYKLNLVSIYTYLENRFGRYTHKTGSGFFLMAHLIGAAFRLYLMAYVLQMIVFDALGIPFAFTVLLILLLIWLYTFKGGIKTVIFTDVLQTTFLLLAAAIGLWSVARSLDLGLFELYQKIQDTEYTTVFDWSWHSPNNFFKLLGTGALLTIVNNGLDQAIMQKHLTCSDLKNAQKNVLALSGILLLVNLLFLFLGAALLFYANSKNVTLPLETDQIYPLLATGHLGSLAGSAFVIGIAAAAYSSADTSLTGLTTSFCIDFLGYFKTKEDNTLIRRLVHLGFTLVIFLFILVFKALNDQSVISAFIKISGYAYGPLLALFAFGMFSKKKLWDKGVPLICLFSPLVAYIIDRNSMKWFNYQLNYETIIINAAVALLGLYLVHWLYEQETHKGRL